MNLLAHGNNIFPVEVTNISNHGIWLISNQNEYFLSYKDFPWFKNQTVAAIFNVEELTNEHFYWPGIDVDLTLDMIKEPDKYPLMAK